MIHICFALYDKAGHYSKFLGTAICSLFENTNSEITVHILYDNTLTENNRDKLIQLIERYNQIVKFYNVEELCSEEFAKIQEFFPNIFDDRHSIAMFYRLFIPRLLLPQNIEKALYLDADIIVNINITELLQIELGDKPFGAIPEVDQFKNRDDGLQLKKNTIKICGEGFVNVEDYFNSGVMLINLKVLHEKENVISAGMKFISEHPQFTFLDQDLLNYCFATTYLKLPTKFNRFVLYAKRENEWTIEKKIYHFAASRLCFVMDSRDPYNQLFMKYFIKTPWVDEDTRLALSGGIPSPKNYQISVIIPMYNAEEFIGECLDSLLVQTFQASEVIVVDDCSTDDSVSVVESYKDKFNGRLKLVKTEVNSGGGGYIPRNTGIKIANSKYVYFLDADDMILGTALESLYMAAILYDADVVYTNSYYDLTEPNDIYLKKSSAKVKTRFTVDNLNENLDHLFPKKGGDLHTPWTRFIRRDFLMENNIFFPHIYSSGDFIWVINVYCHARRFLRISTPICLHRTYNTNSITRTVREPKEQYWYWFCSLLDFAKKVHEMEQANEILLKNPSYGLMAIYQHLKHCFSRIVYAEAELDMDELYKILYSKFVKISSDSSALLLVFFFSFIDSERRINEYYSEIFNKFKDYFTARLDMQLVPAEGKGDFQIISVSDKKAAILKPGWLQEGGIGYQILSRVGKMEIVAKATADGQLQVKCKGMDIRDKEDDSKRVPYWIDYTKLTVNSKTVFDARTPAWHDKPYTYALEIKSGEEIKIETEWLPHREIPAIAPPKKPRREDAIIRKFKDYFTARLDMQLDSETEPCEFQILTISDDKAKVGKASWLPENADGCFIQSYNGNMEVIAKAAADGQLQIKLKGVDVRDKEDDSKRIPYWIDYTKLTINDEVIFDARTPAWHDKPYICTLEVKADEEIKIQTEWLPHREIPAIAPPKKPRREDAIIRKFKDYFTARLDMQLDSETEPCEFQILTISDDKAKVGRASWLPENADGCFIQSYNGNMEVIAKAAADGQLQIKLKGVDVRDKEDNSKRIPYWIDYTKLTINDEVIFDARTPAWHDKPYIYTLEVKADNEIKIQTEWLPHKEEPAVIEPPKEDEAISKFKDYFTARLDMQLDSETTPCEFKILTISDDKAKVGKASWLPENADGCFIQSYNGNMEVVAKAAADGQLQIKLKGVDVRDKEDDSKRIPYWIDYTKLTINDEVIFDARTPAWHDKPYIYTLEVKADDEIKIQTEWLPHREIPAIAPPKKPRREDAIIRKFKDYFTARIDMQLDSETTPCEFKILTISDDKAKVGRASWLPENADGCFIQSYNGNMEVIAKAAADGQLQVKLKGVDVRDKEDNSKCIPYWIDYTKLTINDEVIFDARTPAWHDKPYIYTLEVKADDEIKIQTEWLPHREIPAIAPPKKPRREDAIIRKFKDYFTARLDMQLDSETEPCEFQILSISDDKAKVGKASWLPENADGCFIQSYNGNMEVIAKAAADGQLQVKLKGVDVRDKEDNSKCIPYWIDYTKLTINDEVIFDARTPAWHDKPYIYTLEVKADDEIKIQTEWLPHKEEPAVIEPPKEDKIIDKKDINSTARIDVKLVSNEECELKIVSASDEKADIRKAGWLPKNENGYFIHSDVGDLEIVAKAEDDGKINLDLKGMDIRDKEDRSKRVPCWIDYTRLIVNGKKILGRRISTWHNRPYRYTTDVKAGDEIKIKVTWLPHKGE